MPETSAGVKAGDLLAGKYRVQRVLGSGGMGVVVAARHEQLGQLVAIKFMRDEALGNEEAVGRFLREARAAVRLKSEHVARVLDVGTLESGAPYMVMEYLEGSDLAEALQKDGPMSAPVAATLIIQACEAVAEAHSTGIVHRDIKPQNLFLTSTLAGLPKIKVLDFGVSKAMGLTSEAEGALTRTSAMLGSPLYMAPEQMRSARDVDARADVWALGVVLFELLTQRWPFEAESFPALCLKVVSDPPLSLALLRPDVPADFVAIVERCLQKDPTLRYQSASALARALVPYASAPFSKKPPSSRDGGSPTSSTFVPGGSGKADISQVPAHSAETILSVEGASAASVTGVAESARASRATSVNSPAAPIDAANASTAAPWSRAPTGPRAQLGLVSARGLVFWVLGAIVLIAIIAVITTSRRANRTDAASMPLPQDPIVKTTAASEAPPDRPRNDFGSPSAAPAGASASAAVTPSVTSPSAISPSTTSPSAASPTAVPPGPMAPSARSAAEAAVSAAGSVTPAKPKPVVRSPMTQTKSRGSDDDIPALR